MANGKIRFGKQSGGELSLVIPDGVANTEVVVPESGTLVSVDTTVTDNSIVRFDGTTGKIQNSSITIDDGGNVGSGTQSFNGFGGSGFKNLLINGNFSIWQRGTSFTGLTNGSYSVDRWCVYDYVGNINYNTIRNAGVFQSGYGATYTFNSGTGIRSIIQFIENITRFKVGSKVSISFEAYTDSTPYNISVAIQGIIGIWAAVTGEVSQTIALTNTKTRYEVTLTVPDWSTLGINWSNLEDTKLGLKFNLGIETNGRNFIISNVQLEEGSVATPFENRPYTLELMLCKRYYRKSFGYETTPVNGSSPTLLADVSNAIILPAIHRSNATNDMTPKSHVFDVEMRVAPTLFRYGNSDGLWFFRDSTFATYSTNLNIYASKYGLSIINEVSPSYDGIVIGHYAAVAEL